MLRSGVLLIGVLLSNSAHGQDNAISVAAGERIARIGGCHDCHTPGFGEANGELDPARALIGNPVDYNGPWGTTYAANLRLVAAEYDQEQWVDYLRTLQNCPPMPWFNLHHLEEAEMRSLHQYILSLGEPGEPAPAYVPPGKKPTTPYIIMAPPTMPE